VQLSRAVEEGGASAVCDEVNFQLLMRTDSHHVFENSGGRCAGHLHDLQPMALQMQREDLVTGVADPQPVA